MNILKESSRKKEDLINSLNKMIECFANDNILSLNNIIDKINTTNNTNKNDILLYIIT